MPRNEIEITSGRENNIRQRRALHSILATDEEYSHITDYVDVDTDVSENLSRELVDYFDKKTMSSPQNVMQIVQYDMQGYPTTLIATQMGMKPSQIQKIKESEVYRLAKEEVIRSVVESSRKYMEVATIKAVKTLVECMDSNNEKVRLAASQDILNRAGLAAPQQIEIKSTVNSFDNFTDEELAEIIKKETAISSKAEVIHIDPAAISEI